MLTTLTTPRVHRGLVAILDSQSISIIATQWMCIPFCASSTSERSRSGLIDTLPSYFADCLPAYLFVNMRAPMSSPKYPKAGPSGATATGQKRAPTSQMLRQMMARAAATASAATGDAFHTPASVPEPVRQRAPAVPRPPSARRLSINQLPPMLSTELIRKGAPLPPPENGIRLNRINEVMKKLKQQYRHPATASQVETDTLHQIRAILYMNRALVTQSFISHVSGVSQGSLSHYVRGLFKGNQPNVDQRLAKFVEQFANGELDSYLEEIRNGSRSAARPLYIPSAQTTPSPAVLTPVTPAVTAPTEKAPIPPPPPPQLHPAPWARPVEPQEGSVAGEPTNQQPQSEEAPTKTVPENPDGEKSVPIDPSSQNFAEEAAARVAEQIAGKMAQQQHLTTPATAQFQAGNTCADGRSAAIGPIPVIGPPRRTRKRKRKQPPSVPQMAKPTQPLFPKTPHEPQTVTPEMSVDRAYHSVCMADWTTNAYGAEPLLVPIELFVSIDDMVMHTYTEWDVNERELSPEVAADRLRKSRNLPQEFIRPIAMQIRRALFDSGVLCAAPPATEPTENRRHIRFSVELNEENSTRVLSDECEWDLATGGLNSPERFAQQLCLDAGISQRHVGAVAEAIRKKLRIAQAIAYGDEATRLAAMEGLSEDDPVRRPLPPVRSALDKSTPEDQRARERKENEKKIMDAILNPLVGSVPEEADRRSMERKRKAAEERLRKEQEELNRRKEEEIARRKAKLEEGIKEAESEALRIYEERNLDFRPYLGLTVARGERPSLWLPPAFDRRRRKQLTFPMVQQVRRNSTAKSSSSARSSKRKRPHSRRDRAIEAGIDDDGDDNADGKGETDSRANSGKLMDSQDDKMGIPSILLNLRIKPPPGDVKMVERDGKLQKEDRGKSKRRRRK